MATDTITDEAVVIEDGSHFVDTFDRETVQAAGATLAKAAARTLEKGTDYVTALVLLVGVIVSNVRDEAGFPCWNLADLPDAAKEILQGIATAANLSDEQRASVLRDAPRQAWNRWGREAFMYAHVAANYANAKATAGQEVQTQAANNYARALKLLPEEIVGMLPEPLDSSLFLPSGVNKEAKKGMREQYTHAKITLPEKYGGEPKGGNAKGTKDKQAASPETVLEEVATATEKAGTEGGPSHHSVTRGSLRVLSALVLSLLESDEITDRTEVESDLLRIASVASIGAKYCANKYNPDTDGEQLAAAVFDPKQDK